MRCRALVSLVVGSEIPLEEFSATVRWFEHTYAATWHGDASVRMLQGHHGSAILWTGVFIGLSWEMVQLLARFVAERHDCWVVASHWDMEQSDDAINAQAFPPKGAW